MLALEQVPSRTIKDTMLYFDSHLFLLIPCFLPSCACPAMLLTAYYLCCPLPCSPVLELRNYGRESTQPVGQKPTFPLCLSVPSLLSAMVLAVRRCSVAFPRLPWSLMAHFCTTQRAGCVIRAYGLGPAYRALSWNHFVTRQSHILTLYRVNAIFFSWGSSRLLLA